MIETLLLVVAMYAILSLVGWMVLASLDVRTRDVLLPAAPVFGAALVAAVCSTTTRWVSVPVSLLAVAAALVACAAVARSRGQRPWRVSRRTVAGLLLCPVLSLGGAGVAALPSIWVGDHRPVAATVIVDQFYFAATSSYLTDEPLLPGPYWNAGDWAGSATPSVGPVVDVISNRFRYGQASVASALSFVTGQDPSDTVTPISIMLLVMVGSAIFVAARLLGLRRRWACTAVPLATSSMYLTTQSLEGKNDGLLGVSLALVALTLSYAVTRHRRFMWPTVVSVAGLAASYSELVFVLVLPVALLTVWGPRARLLERLNRVAAAWAIGVVVTPFAWIWLAQSARIGGRYSDGSTPFDDRRGFALLRAVIGIDPAVGQGGASWFFSVLAVIVLLAVTVGLAGAIAATPARGAALGLVLALGLLELSALRADAGNLQYRTAQLGYSFVLLFAVIGWAALAQRWPLRHSKLRVPLTGVVVVGVIAVFSLSNVATAATHLSRERAEVQHVAAAELDEAAAWVRDVGPSNVSVVVPRFTDLIWLALELRRDKGVNYPVVPAIYLGSFPRWDREPDRYYLTGVGTTLAGEDTVVQENSRYQLVEMGRRGMVMTPFQPTFYWARPTYMRGFPCAKDGSQMLLLRGSQDPGTFDVASRATTPVSTPVGLDIDGTPVNRTGPPVMIGWLERPDLQGAAVP